MQAGGQDQRGAHLRAEPPQHTLNAGIGLAANGCVFMQGGEKEKKNTPQNRRLGKKKEAHPRAKHQHHSNKTTAERAGCEGRDTHTQTPATSRWCLPEPPRQTAPVPHATAATASWELGAEPSAGAKQWGPAEAHSGEPPRGQLGKTKPRRKTRHQHIAGAHSHPLGVLVPCSQPLAAAERSDTTTQALCPVGTS